MCRDFSEAVEPRSDEKSVEKRRRKRSGRFEIVEGHRSRDFTKKLKREVIETKIVAKSGEKEAVEPVFEIVEG